MKATTWLLTGLLAIALAASTASADASLTIEDLPEAASAPLEEGGSVSLPFTVVFEANEFGCVQGGSFNFAVTLQASPPPGVSAVVDPEEGSMSVDAGLYSEPVQTYRNSFSGNVRVSAESISANATLPLKVNVNYDGNMPEACNGTLPAQDASADTSVELLAPPPEPEPEPEPEEKNGLPAPGLVGLLAAVGVAFAMRRR